MMTKVKRVANQPTNIRRMITKMRRKGYAYTGRSDTGGTYERGLFVLLYFERMY